MRVEKPPMIVVNNRDKLDWREGMTVQDVLNAMRFDYALIVVSVNGAQVEKDAFATHPVPDGASVQVIHIAHGG
ncbi:MAG: sulfur carrier protein ThiS [Deltaproteobacteria bacterium]|nr:sulfur carrier protein ThiS [Deltaproteobacteria bacterium]